MKAFLRGVRLLDRGWLKKGGVHKLFLILGGAFKRGKAFIGGFTITTQTTANNNKHIITNEKV